MIAACLLLKVDQSEEVNRPRLDEEESGKLNVCTLDELEILKSEPDVPLTSV